MTKEQFIEQWLDKYEQAHPDERLDYDALREQADCEWYDKEVDRGNATEYDLSAEQQKAVKAAMQGMAHRSVNAYGKEVKRVRKPNEAKRELVQAIADALAAYGADISNPERQVDFTWQGTAYSVTLTAHRPPKAK